MEQFLEATVLGLATASVLAIAASGLVLTYTTTGIFNFAHGALGMLGAFTYWQLRFDWGWPAPVALLVILGVLAPLVGVIIEVGIMRGLTDAPETVRVVVSISLLVALLGLGLWVWRPDQAHPLEPFWGAGSSFNELLGADDGFSLELFGSTFFHDLRISNHEAAAFGIAVALALGLRLLLYSSRTGIAMRAAVDDRGLAALNGARPVRAGMLAWAIGCACAALGGILMSAMTPPLSHVNLTLLIVNAYAAAMIGRLRGLPLTFLGAMVLGVADSLAITYLPDDSRVFDQFRYALPALVLFVVLLVLRQPRPRGHGLTRTREHVPRPSWTGALVAAGAFVGAGAYLAQILSEADARSVARIVALAIIGLSLVPLVGFAGQLSLCQLSFAGVGAVVMAHHGVGGDPLGLLYAALAAGAVGAVVALPAIRLGGLYFALATAAFAMLMDKWIFVLREPFELGPFTIKIFPSGFASVPRADLPGAGSDAGLLVLLSVVFALLYLLVVMVRRSTLGQRLLAMKESPAASATIGMNITATKFVVFTLSAAMAGLGGALYGGTLGAEAGSVTPEHFAFFQSLPLLLLGVVGGIGSAAGALLAGLMLGGMPMLIDTWPWMENVSRVLPGTMGVALGRNPNGIAHDLRLAFAPVARAPLALATTLVATAAVLGLRLAELVDGWAFAGLLLVAVVVGPALARVRRPHRAAVAAGVEGTAGVAVAAAGLAGASTSEAAASGAHDEAPVVAEAGAGDEARPDVPLEWLGIERPFTPADVAALDRALGLQPVRGAR